MRSTSQPTNHRTNAKFCLQNMVIDKLLLLTELMIEMGTNFFHVLKKFSLGHPDVILFVLLSRA